MVSYQKYRVWHIVPSNFKNYIIGSSFGNQFIESLKISLSRMKFIVELMIIWNLCWLIYSLEFNVCARLCAQKDTHRDMVLHFHSKTPEIGLCVQYARVNCHNHILFIQNVYKFFLVYKSIK